MHDKIGPTNDKITKQRLTATAKIINELKPILAEYSDKNSIALIVEKKNIIIGKADLDITKDVIKNKDARGIKYLWMQLTVRNDYAAELAEEAGLEVIMDRCPKIEFGRLSGELSWLGVNSGIITSKTLKSPKHD